MSNDHLCRPRAYILFVCGVLLFTASIANANDHCLCECSTHVCEKATDCRDADEEDYGCLNNWLVGDCFSRCTGFHVAGWLQQGFTWNPDRPVDRFNGPVTQNDRANEYQLNQLYFSAARPSDSDAGHLSFGFQVDALYGTDAIFFQSLGLDDRIVSDSASRFYKLAFPQMYAEVYAPIGPGITFQVGKWYALVGYETGLATEDFFYSRTISFLGTPYTHTGILATFDLTHQLSTSHGIHRGSDVWEDNNSALGYTGGLTWTSCSEATILTCAINLGPEQDVRADWQDIDGMPGPDSPGESLTRTVYSVSLEQQLTDRLQYVFVHDGYLQDGSRRYGIDRAEGYGITQYLLYEHCECVAAGVRLEVYRDDDGFIASGCRSENPASPGVYTNLTAGLQLRPYENLQVRPEVRWDWQNLDQPASPPAFNNGTSTKQFLFSLDIVAKF